ncbi:MAG: hypothetical protein IPM48_14915 [Saprospiraceae bacterium]|nr:hypothetical protein [Saprospiraceae bacterium]
MRGRFNIKLNVSYELRDKDGNLKPIFQPNRLFRWLLKKNIVSPHFPKINYLFGNWSNRMVMSNLVTNAGKAAVAALINGATAIDPFDYIANGTGTTAAAVTDTALETESSSSGLTRAQDASPTRDTTDVTNDTAVVTKAFSVTGSVAITECGLLNASSDGILLARQVFAAVNVVDGDTWTPTWNIDVD